MANRLSRPALLAISTGLVGAALIGVTLNGGCAVNTAQSAVHPAGPAAAAIAWLWWLLCIVCTVVLVVVTVLMLMAVSRRFESTDARPPLGVTSFIVVGGIVVPFIVLVGLLFFTLQTTLALKTPREGLTIQVVGHMWWWEVRYPEQGIVTANEIHIPAGSPVRLELTSADVIHSFWVPSLNGKRDMVPGHVNDFWIQADRPGVYRGQCAEFCGTQHALMAFEVIALPPEEFAAWLANPRQTPVRPAGSELQQGEQVFFRSGCHNCHAIRGTGAAGRVGPDLTNFGTRRTIGSATLANTPGNLAGWISDPQPLKPGNKMPATHLTPADLHLLVTYLRSLQ